MVVQMTDPSLPADAQRNERTLLFITSLGHAICHMGELLFTGVTLAVMVEYGLAPHVATALALLGYILLGAGAIPMGAWADARGPARVHRAVPRDRRGRHEILVPFLQPGNRPTGDERGDDACHGGLRAPLRA